MRWILPAALFFMLMTFAAAGPAPIQSRTGAVTGQVLRDGKPAASIRVVAMDASRSDATTFLGVTQTDPSGRYRLDDLPPGNYYIAGGLLDSPTYYPGVATTRDAKTIAIKGGEVVANIDFTIAALSTGLTVSGRVIRPPGQPAEGADSVSLFNSLAPGIRTSLTGAGVRPDGTFEIQKVSPGSYTLRLRLTPFFDAPTIQVVDRDVTGVEIVVHPTVAVQGAIAVDGNGLQPSLNLQFAFKDGSRSPASAVASNGTFSAQLLAGEYRVSWSALPEGYSIKSMTSGTTNLLTEPLKVSAGQENAWIVVRIAVSSPPPWVKVRGKVTGWSNTAPSLPNAVPPMVSLNPTQASGFIGGSNPPRLPPPAPAPIAPDGVFEFPRVPRGTYNVGVFPAPAGGPPAVLFAANDVDDLRIAVPESREIAGQVEVEGNGPMPRLLFTLVDPKDDRTLGSAHAGVPMADGAFKITLPDAGFRLRLWCCLPPGYTLESMTYDGIDLKSNPLKLSGPDAMLRLRFATSSKNWFRVSGTVTGAGAKPASMKVSLIPEPHVTENDFPQTTVISTDGSFEFPAVVPGTYLAKLTPLPDGAIESRILVKVGDANVTEVQIHAPAYVRMPVRVSVEGNSPAPRVVFRSSADAELRPLSYPNLPGPVDLSLVLPEGEQSVTIVPEFLPRGYTVKAFTADGKTDLLRETLKVSANTPPELQIEFGVPPDSLFRITGRSLRFPEGGAAFAGDEPIVFLSGEPTLRFVGWRDCSMIPSGGVCIGLTARIAADGTFEFPAVPAGSYKLTVRDLRPAPVTVTVTNKDVIGIEIP